MTRQDWIDLVRLLPVAAVVLVGLWAFLVLVIAIVPGPAR